MSRARGFSLLEMIVALAILVVGTSSALALFAVAAASHKRAVDYAVAAQAAQSIFPEIEQRWTLIRSRTKAGKVKDLPDPIPKPGESEPTVPGYPQYAYRIEFSRLDDEGDVVLAELTILWQRGGAAVSKKFRQVLLRQAF